jgi:hypothetical protein
MSPGPVRGDAAMARMRPGCNAMQCNHVPLKLNGLDPALASQVAGVNDWTLQQLCDWVRLSMVTRVVLSTMWKTLARLGLSLEKAIPCRRADAPGRSPGKSGIAGQPDTPVSRLVFLDVTWASTTMAPTRGRSAIGERCLGRAPYGHWKTTTFVCTLRTTGLVAPLVLDGPINGLAFRGG